MKSRLSLCALECRDVPLWKARAGDLADKGDAARCLSTLHDRNMLYCTERLQMWKLEAELALTHATWCVGEDLWAAGGNIL